MDISRSLALCDYFNKKGLKTYISGISKQAKNLLGNKNKNIDDPKFIIFDSHNDIDKLIYEYKKR